MNKKLLSGFGVRIGLVIFLLLLPLENVYASFCNRNFTLSTLILIVITTLILVVFMFVLMKGKELLSRVVVFCILLVMSFFWIINYEYKIMDFYTRVECKIFGGELKSGYCNLYCEMPKK